MGAASLFELLCNRYPDLNKNFDQALYCDKMYVDMMQIMSIVVRNRTNDGIDDVFENICAYLNKLVYLVKPRQLLYISIDGISPYGKLKNLRSKSISGDCQNPRFKVSTGAEDMVPPLSTKDKNTDILICPHSDFMFEFQKYLGVYIELQMNMDNLWRNLTVILNGDEVPGEAEHKIFDFIRYKRSEKDYSPNSTHCIYSRDADVIILALATHEANIVVMRETVLKTKNIFQYIEKKSFNITDIDVLRRYIQDDFGKLKNALKSEYDFERILDDFIFMTLFLGNDYVFYTPCCQDSHTGMPILIYCYLASRNQMKGYLTEHGIINIQNYLILINEISRSEKDYIKNQIEKSSNKSRSPAKFLQDYHSTKLHCCVTADDIQFMATEYMKALQWSMLTYLYGIYDWTYRYPFEYSPFLLDMELIDLKTIAESLMFDKYGPYSDPHYDLERSTIFILKSVNEKVKVFNFHSSLLDVVPKEVVLYLMPGARRREFNNLAPINHNAKSKAPSDAVYHPISEGATGLSRMLHAMNSKNVKEYNAKQSIY